MIVDFMFQICEPIYSHIEFVDLYNKWQQHFFPHAIAVEKSGI